MLNNEDNECNNVIQWLLQLSLKSYLLSSQLIVHIKGEIYRAYVQSVLKYVTEAWEMKAENLKSFQKAEHMMVRWTWSVLEAKKAEWLYFAQICTGHNCSYVDPSSTDFFHFFLKLYWTFNHFFVCSILIL